jgi:hypothetical protein
MGGCLDQTSSRPYGPVGQVVAFGLLFTPSARRWMNREDERAKLREVSN